MKTFLKNHLFEIIIVVVLILTYANVNKSLEYSKGAMDYAYDAKSNSEKAIEYTKSASEDAEAASSAAYDASNYAMDAADYCSRVF